MAEYLVDLNGTRAAVRAGYSERTAASQGARLLRNVKVRGAIDAGMAARSQRVEITQDEVLRELRRLALVDVSQAFDEHGHPRPLHELPEDLRRALAGVEVRIEPGQTRELDDGPVETRPVAQVVKLRFWDKVKSLELLGKHLGMFQERVQLDPGPGWADLVAASMKPRGDG